MMGAGGLLRWQTNETLLETMNSVISGIKQYQEPDGCIRKKLTKKRNARSNNCS
jgi:hypothetical protein